MSYICPECHKSLKNKHSLAEHTKRVHGSELTPKTIGKLPIPRGPKSKAKAQKFQVAKPPPPAKTTYKCGACGASLDGEVSPCPKCSAELKWS